jgi:hypothetical protein
MRARLTTWSLLGVLLVLTVPAFAQAATRANVIWARKTTSPITLDGILSEPAWAQAESTVIWYGRDNGQPGSGYKEEGGRLAKDSTYAIVKFLRVGNQLYMAATVRDSSVGGSGDFNRFDGLLMAVKDHRDPAATQHGPLEHFYSWWHPELASLNNPGAIPGFRGTFGAQDTVVRDPASVAAWDAVTKVRGGISNTDADVDSGYTVEMRFDVTATGYDFSQAVGDIFEWNVSIYDTDWYWPINLYRFSANRTWWQGPWGNDLWYDEVRVYGRDDVTTTSGPVPDPGPEFTVKNLGALSPPKIDGDLSDAVWAQASTLQLAYDDFTPRNGYTGAMKWRAGQYQATVLGSQALVLDPNTATVKTFFKDDTLYFGFDVNDAVVQYYSLEDRWDGFRVSIQERVARYRDRNLESRPITFIVGPDGKALPMEYLPFLKDTLGGARVALKLKPGTTVDTLGQDIDAGYTAELAIDMTKLGYPHGLGDGTLWFGISHYDGDSFTPFTDSYGTRTWYAREREHRCCPANGYMDPNSYVVLGVEDGATLPETPTLLGSYPNPFRQITQLRFSLPAASRAALEVFDLAGRRVASRPLGVLSAGRQQTTFSRGSLASGLYLYRIRLSDPSGGGDMGSLSGKMMIVK